MILLVNFKRKPTMSTAELNALRNAAMALPENERAILAKDLVASLDGAEDEDVAQAWDIEICRRINEVHSGRAQLFDSNEVLARARARLKR
jgi:putative addiction module component (TIGR02574 family)